MYMRQYIIILFTLLLLGCNRNPGNGQADYRAERNVLTHTIGDSLVVGVPVDLCADGDYLFVLAYTPDNWLHIYDKNTGNKISEAIAVGRGPGEGLNIVSMDYWREEHTVYMYDMVLNKTLVYHFNGDTAAVSFVREIRNPKEGVVRGCHILPNNRLLYEGYIPEYGNETRFSLLEGEKVLDLYSDYPGITNKEDQTAFILGVSKADPNSGRLVVGTTFGAVLECFDISGEIIKPIATRIIDLPEMDLSGRSVKMKDGGKYGFSTICLTEKLIYTCYIDSVDPAVFNTIASFDWRGREQTKYSLDQNILRLCPGFDKRGRFYGISSSPDMVFSLVWFELD